jgi:hypothetical protein
VAESCLKQLSLDIPLKGTGRLKTEFATEGRDGAELLGGLSGTIKIVARDGMVPVDFARLAAGTIPLEGQSWSGSGGTTFASLNADCRLGGGHIWCQTFNMQTPDGLVSGSGAINLPQQTLDWDVAIGGRADQPNDSAPVTIRGPFSQPTIKRADRAALGDGRLQPPSVSPH